MFLIWYNVETPIICTLLVYLHPQQALNKIKKWPRAVLKRFKNYLAAAGQKLYANIKVSSLIWKSVFVRQLENSLVMSNLQIVVESLLISLNQILVSFSTVSHCKQTGNRVSSARRDLPGTVRQQMKTARMLCSGVQLFLFQFHHGFFVFKNFQRFVERSSVFIGTI